VSSPLEGNLPSGNFVPTTTATTTLRVALLAGCLARHGAEKQAVLMARALRRAGVEVHIHALTRGDHYERVLRGEGFVVEWAGRFRNPLLRVAVLAKQMWSFKPHIVQATHGHNNLHAALAARLLNAISVGALRTDLSKCREQMGFWTSHLFRFPTGIIVNSQRAELQLRDSGLTKPDRVWLLPNVVDLAELGADPIRSEEAAKDGRVTAVFLSRLVSLKRLDLFLLALAAARKSAPWLRGLVVGDGPEREPMQRLAAELGLLPEYVSFTGESIHPGEQLRKSDFLVLCSDHEGSPNAVLEALAMGKPAIVTPAGDAPLIVQHGLNGFVVPFDDSQELADRMVELACSPALRVRMGRAGREHIEESYSLDGLAEQLLRIYAQAATRRHSRLPAPVSAVVSGASRPAR
jgi:glycosyltransferase involved in cell wall biosynthesis